MTNALPQSVKFSELVRWDVKYFWGQIKSKYPLVSLATFVHDHNEKIRPFEYPEDTFKILGVNNTHGIFHAYNALGKDIKQPYKKVSADDFAYNPYRINVGSIGRVSPEHDGAFISPAYVVFSIDKKVILPELFWFILKSEFFNQTLRAATAGSVRMNLTYPLLETLKIPVPPISVQKKIVGYWQHENSGIVAKKTQSQEIEKSIHVSLMEELGFPYKKQKKHIALFIAKWKNINRWGVKRCRDLDNRQNLKAGIYPTKRLFEIIDGLQTGWSPKCLPREARLNEWGVLKLGAISFGEYDETSNKALPPKIKHRKDLEVCPGDILINRGNVLSLVGAVIMVSSTRKKLMIPDLVFRVIGLDETKILPTFLVSILRTPLLRREIESIATGSSPTMKKITKIALLSLKIPPPDLDKQQQISSKINMEKIEESNSEKMQINNC